jgi:hypothetical protein|tara:strand:- start:545 stop:799 length:255 start_codon:yes stop_codon:yes gene_type:complete
MFPQRSSKTFLITIFNFTHEEYYVWQQPKVVDRGSKEQSLKVITNFGPSVDIAYLQVGLFYSDLKKPFLYFNNTDIYAGLCGDL